MAEYLIADTAHDGQVQATGATYPPGGTPTVNTGGISVEKSLKAGPTHDLRVALFRWDTSDIDDGATIASATLRIYLTGKVNSNDRSLTAEWYDAGTIGSEDWTSTVGTDAHAGTSLDSLNSSADNDLALLDVNANINKTGFTGLRLHISGGEPTGDNWVTINDFGEIPASGARLIVELASAPSDATLHVVQSGLRW